MEPALLWAPMRRWLLSAGAAAVICGPTVMAFYSGGFFDRPRLIAALVVWAMVIVIAVAAVSLVPTATPGRVALAALFLLTLWTTASVAWAPLGGRAVDDVQRLLLYLGYFVCALALHAPSAFAQCQEWTSGFECTGVNGTVHDAITFDDGNGPALYIASAAVGQAPSGTWMTTLWPPSV